MKKYRVNYYFDGCGSAIINANSAKEAKQKWFDGDVCEDQDNSDNYCIDTVEEITGQI